MRIRAGGTSGASEAGEASEARGAREDYIQGQLRQGKMTTE